MFFFLTSLQHTSSTTFHPPLTILFTRHDVDGQRARKKKKLFSRAGGRYKGNCFTRFMFRIFIKPWLQLVVDILALIIVHQLTKKDSTMAYRTRNSSSMLGCAAFIVMVCGVDAFLSFPIPSSTFSWADWVLQIASLFFWLSAFSTPFIKSIYYLESRTNDVRVSSLQSTLDRCVELTGSLVTLDGATIPMLTVNNESGKALFTSRLIGWNASKS